MQAFIAKGSRKNPRIAYYNAAPVTPAWDDDIFITSVSGNKDLECWDMPGLIRSIDSIRADNSDNAEIRDVGKGPMPMTKWRNDEYIDLNAMVLAENAIVAAYSNHRWGSQDTREWQLGLFNRESGDTIATMKLPSEPLKSGIALGSDGQIVVALISGEILYYNDDGIVSVAHKNAENMKVPDILRKSAELGVMEGSEK